MKRAVHILLLATLLPLPSMAREETLEERKQRITRKYMRERTQVAQSDLYVPENIEEDERAGSSELFKKLDPKLEQDEGLPQPPPPPPQQVIPYNATENWLLTDPSIDADPFANPLDPYQTEGSTDSQSEYWALFGGRPSDVDKSASVQREKVYKENALRSLGLDTREPDRFGTRSSEQRTGIFGQLQTPKAEDQTQNNFSSGFGRSKPRTYGSSPDTGLLNTPFSRRSSAGDSNARERQQVVPRRSVVPLNRSPSAQQQYIKPETQYTKPDAFQQYKKRNKAWDPTGDDAYLDELMNKDRR